ncbi:response regulator [Cellvibrio sp.]|uniref:response regulator n=1 Tax=Cellvibrio sp. TaxID=1965322 RepID=UPI0039647BAD
MAVQASSAKQVGKVFQVAVLGVGTNDLEIFSRIFAVTRYRPRTYHLKVVSENSSLSELGSAANADIYVVNLHNTHAVHCWHRLSAMIAKDRRKPVLKISKITPATEAGSEFTISWPINPAKLLQSLDNYTIRHLHYYPEFEIGSEVEPSVAIVKNFKAINLTTHAQQTTPQENKLRVLVADDSLAVRRQLKMEFDAMDAKLNVVADGEAAVNAAEKDQYDVIFLDVVMPGIDGYAACKNIKRSKLNKHTPVIMLTSRSSKFDKLKGVLAGCDTYLTKPINHNEFKEITQKHLDALNLRTQKLENK